MATEFTRITPILRIFDVAKAKEFYIDFLGFTVDWEHRFAEDLPLYLQVSRGAFVLHLSEHYGDCSPCSTVYVKTVGVDELGEALLAKQYRYLRPRVEETPWCSRMLQVTDPFGNRLRFDEPQQ